jgi:hypothetical protein
VINEAAAAQEEWVAAKLIIAEFTGVSKDALHVLVGLIGVVVLAALLRRSLGSALPALIVLGVELLNEAVDRMEVWKDRPMWPGSVKDIALTMAAPVILLIAVRWLPKLFQPSTKAAPNPEISNELSDDGHRPA